MEAVKSRADRRVRGEQVPSSCNIQGNIERLLPVLHVGAGALKGSERRMALVEVAYLRP